jgi:hypothetical protein
MGQSTRHTMREGREGEEEVDRGGGGEVTQDSSFL